jgi:hypothetical protein
VSAPVTPAEALVWVAHLLGTEESARLYAYPRSDEQMAEAAELGAIRDHVCAEYLAKTGSRPLQSGSSPMPNLLTILSTQAALTPELIRKVRRLRDMVRRIDNGKTPMGVWS